MRLLLGFGFLAAEVDKIGFGLGHGITLLYKSHSTFLLVRGTLHPIVANQLEVVVLLSLYLAVLDDQSNEEQFIDSGTGAKTMHTRLAGQFRHLAFENLFSVLIVAQLLFCFGFFAAEIGKVGFGLGQWHHAPFK